MSLIRKYRTIDGREYQIDYDEQSETFTLLGPFPQSGGLIHEKIQDSAKTIEKAVEKANKLLDIAGEWEDKPTIDTKSRK